MFSANRLPVVTIDAPTLLKLLRLAKVLQETRDELTRWGWGDFHYGETPQEKPVVDAVAKADAALIALDER